MPDQIMFYAMLCQLRCDCQRQRSGSPCLLIAAAACGCLLVPRDTDTASGQLNVTSKVASYQQSGTATDTVTRI